MKLQRIKLNNFRQFYGAQTLEIAGQADKNVTLVHAENGVGKTTLLNSILWCFYGEVTKKFEKAEQIINFQAVSEGVNTAAVEVFFEHEGFDYLTQRTFTARSGRKPEQVFNAHQIHRGVYKPVEAAETFINSVIPEEMARYYFFDGEHAETFSPLSAFGIQKLVLELHGKAVLPNSLQRKSKRQLLIHTDRAGLAMMAVTARLGPARCHR